MVRKIKFWCNKVLPLVYDDSLSYYEVLCKVVNKINEIIDTGVGISVADPILWSITSQYPQNTIVVDNDGTAYISKQPVPLGVELDNENYWLPIFNYGDNINELRDQIAYNARESNTTKQALNAGDLVFWRGVIYKVLVDMPAGTAFIENTNVVEYTVDARINDAFSAISTLEESIPSTVEEIINEPIENVLSQITYNAQDSTTTEQALNSGDLVIWNDKLYKVTTDMPIGTQFSIGTNITPYTIDEKINDNYEAINEAVDALSLYCYRPDMFGAVGDGVADDSEAVQTTINACYEDGRVLYLGEKTYACANLNIQHDLTIIGGKFKAIPESNTSNQYKNLFTGTDVNVNFERVEFIGCGTALTSTSIIYHFIKFTGGSVKFDYCNWHDLHTLNTNLTTTDFPNRFGVCLTTIDCDTTIINSVFHDLNREELVWVCPLQNYKNKIIFSDNNIYNIGGWSFDFFGKEVFINNNIIDNFISNTSIFNVGGISLVFDNNQVINSIYGNVIDTYEEGYLFCNTVKLTNNYCECGDKSSGYNFTTNFANIRAYNLVAENNVYNGDYFLDYTQNYINAPSVVKWQHIGDYSIDKCIVKNNTIYMGTGRTEGRGCIYVSATAFNVGPILSSNLVKLVTIESNQIIYNPDKPYTDGSYYGIPFGIGSNINICNIINNEIYNATKNGYSTSHMLVTVRPINTNVSIKQLNIIGNYIKTLDSVPSIYLLYASNTASIGSAQIVKNAVGGYNNANVTINNYGFPSGFTLESFKTITLT